MVGYNLPVRSTGAPNRSGYYHYFAFGLESRYIAGLLVRVREEIFQIFVSTFRPSPAQTILDIGVSADDHRSSNHFEKRYPHTERICGLSVERLPELQRSVSGFGIGSG